MNYDFEIFISKINEGLIKTYDIDKTISDLHKLLSNYHLKYEVVPEDNKFKLVIDELDKIENKELVFDSILSSLFNLYGWFPSTMIVQNFFGNKKELKFIKEYLIRPKNNIINAEISFESKFDIVDSNIPTKLYHLSIQQYEENILKNGISPKAKSKLSNHDYDGRIYLCKYLKDCKLLVNRMKLFYSEEKDDIIYDPKNPKRKYNKNTKWIIFEIDTEKASIDKLYKDPNYPDGFYYLNSISPDSITIKEKE